MIVCWTPITLANSEGDDGCRVRTCALFKAQFHDHVGILFLARQFWPRKEPASWTSSSRNYASRMLNMAGDYGDPQWLVESSVTAGCLESAVTNAKS